MGDQAGCVATGGTPKWGQSGALAEIFGFLRDPDDLRSQKMSLGAKKFYSEKMCFLKPIWAKIHKKWAKTGSNGGSRRQILGF